MSTNHMREKHWAVPHLSRARTQAGDLWPWLRREVLPPQRKQQQQSTKLLADSERGAVSPLGNVAQPTPTKAKP
jgi:hypothetical protein